MKFLIGIIVLVLAGAALYQMNQPVAMTDDHSHSDGESHNHDDDMVNGEAEWTTIAPDVSLAPISHASAVVRWGEQLILADPVGDASVYTKYGTPDIVFITHRHGDHFDQANLPAMLTEDTMLITTQDVADQLPEGLSGELLVIAPGEMATFNPLTLEAVAAYNTRPEAQDFHPKERGDIGIVFDDGTSRVYFSGDTEGTPEMLALEDIDVAFVSMNLPFTMSVEDAAEAVLTFAPGAVYPYHFRSRDGLSDVARFGELVNAENSDIDVVILDWYPDNEETGEEEE